ncbi:MAG: tetratricopeptide repeat protein [Rhodospirillales bacterium]|nr:tetratricopeptide repeat protein [Rhodospirillales bacterium]
MAKAKTGRKQQAASARALMAAVAHHGAGRLDQAAAAYQRILKAEPANAQALHLLGVVHHQKGDNEIAHDLISRALEIDPNYADAHGNMGHVLSALHRHAEALSHFTTATVLEPTLAEAHNNLGQGLQQAGRIDDAIDSYTMATTLNPGFAEAWCNNGAAHQELGHMSDAVSFYREALRLRPHYPEALARLAGALAAMGETDEAIVSYRAALDLDPDDATAQANLTSLYIGDETDPNRAIAESMKSLAMLLQSQYGDTACAATIKRFGAEGIPVFRLKHDLQQAVYLAGRRVVIDGLSEFVDAGNGILARAAMANDPGLPVRLERAEAAALVPYLQSGHFHLSAGPPAFVLNPEIDWAAEEQKYIESANEIVHIDDFLSPAALAWFQAYCLESRVWTKEYANKYLGAFSDQGFISPMHLQLGRELREKLPKLFGPHTLKRFWGFKYDAILGKGINVHADFARLNLNFWITPDEHNLTPGTGGLKVYDVPSPANWHFRAYNEGKDAIYRFIADHHGNSVTVPYKCNRAVLFNSAYFHETDELHFADLYEGRRVNVTYLFGSR